MSTHKGKRPPPPPLSTEQVLAWADHHFEVTGQWPRIFSGPVKANPSENWRKIDNAFRYGLRGLPANTSLAKFLDEQRGKRNPSNLPLLTWRAILEWADAHKGRTGRWPDCDAGSVVEAPAETWTGIDQALRQGLRGLPDGDTLARFLGRCRQVRSVGTAPILTVDQIVRWALDHHKLTGEWPNRKSGPVHGVPDETWRRVEAALQAGARDLPRYSSLARLLREECGAPTRLVGAPRPKLVFAKIDRRRGPRKMTAPLRAALASPERAAKIAAAKRGKPRPRHVIEAMRRGRLGKPHSAETRRKMSEAHRRRREIATSNG
jgi:hypothetical protein